MTRIFLCALLVMSGCNLFGVDGDGDGWTIEAGDCDDDNNTINPDAEEVCDDDDHDCDGFTHLGVLDSGGGIVDCTNDNTIIDDPVVNKDCGSDELRFPDADGDGFPEVDPDFPGTCDSTLPKFMLYDPTDPNRVDADCDDTDKDVNPDGEEVCDGVDNDCDDKVDNDAIDAPTWFVDADNDGFGSTEDSVLECADEAPAGYKASNDDCDDSDKDIHPGAAELCEAVEDFNCDGVIGGDDNASDATIMYPDDDGDGFGYNLATPPTFCDEATPGYSTDKDDCDDADAAINPDADEVCDEVDNNCNGNIDDADVDVIEKLVWYADSDNDGFGNEGVETLACFKPEDFVSDSTDCDDSSNEALPGGIEKCDNLDNDCDGDVDEAGSLDETDWYPDFDNDDHGTSVGVVLSCDRPPFGNFLNVDDVSSKPANLDNDCDDANNTVHPDQLEQCDNIDHDCDGDASGAAEDYYRDADSDGYGSGVSLSDCSQPSGYVKAEGDCDDNDADVNPGATEICDGLDNDCDGGVDVGAVPVPWYADVDGDGFGDSSDTQDSCSQPSGYERDDTDCNDSEPAINPDATEICNDAIDNDCDNALDGADTDCGGDNGGTTGSGGTCDSNAGECVVPVICRDVNATTMQVCIKGPLPGNVTSGSLLDSDGLSMDKYYVHFASKDISNGTFEVVIDSNKPQYADSTTEYCSDVARGDWYPKLAGQETIDGTMVETLADINLAKGEVVEGTDLCSINTSGVGGGASGFVEYVGP